MSRRIVATYSKTAAELAGRDLNLARGYGTQRSGKGRRQANLPVLSHVLFHTFSWERGEAIPGRASRDGARMPLRVFGRLQWS
jgi:hypothetical protein